MIGRGAANDKSDILSRARWTAPGIKTMTKLILAPFRSLLRSPLVHFAVVVILILVLQAAPDDSTGGEIFTGLDKLVGSTVDLVLGAFAVKSFTKAWLVSGIMMAYVYVC